ncbi:hypothetical protein Dimus_006709 [Dionaea muscipula]
MVAVGGGGEERRMELEVGEDEGERGNGFEEVVKWEKYLPRMVIRVLLVEADCSTRQIIASLLRKCNYQVAAVPDGLKAWEILKRRHDNFDLILTEFDLPLISGYALLTLIMEQESCKNIPVIMMSQHDSVSMVFKCLRKGAADFLIKPIRRNELKNLWHHVWKRLPINGGQVSNNMTSYKGEAIVKNNEVTNPPCDNASSSMRDRELSEKASDSQSSCTTRYVGAESGYMENMQVISELNHGNVSEMDKAGMEPQKKKLKRDEDLDLLVPKEGLGGGEKSINLALVRLEEGQVIHQDIGNYTCHEPPHSGVIDLIGRLDDQQRCTLLQCNFYDENNQQHDVDVAPQLELSLAFQESQNQARDERTKLGHSNASAFSWYGNSKKFQALSPSSSSTDTELKGEQSSVNRQLVTSEDAVDTCLFLKSSLVSEEGNNGQSVGNLDIQLGLAHGAGNITEFPAMLNPQQSVHRLESSPFLTTSPGPGTHSSSLGCRCLDQSAGGDVYCNVESMPQQPETDAGNDIPPAAMQRVSGTLCCNATAATCGSASAATESQHAPAVAIAGNGDVGEDLKDDRASILMHNKQVVGNGSLHSAEREAALAKFRLKRKDRCYEKKVRYQSRKRLAEQRPRVKGQFVRHVQMDQPHSACRSSSEDKAA